MAEVQTPVPDASDNLTPLPKRVADELGDGDHLIADPVEFVEQLLERATALLATLQADVAGLEADQHDERVRIEKDWRRQQEAVDAATDRLTRMYSHAQQIAAHKARLTEFEAAINPDVPPAAPESVTVEEFDALMARIDDELKAARGITGAIRLPQIARLLTEAEGAVARLADQADVTRLMLLALAEDELDTEGKEARASFEIGLGVLQRDLEVLERGLPLTARAWSDPGWETWDAPATPREWIRVGVQVHSRLPDTPIPLLMPVVGGPGLVIESGTDRELAADGVRSVVLRLLAALPPGQARFTFVDPKAMGETVAPFLALADYDADLVGDGALVLEDQIEHRLEQLTRHVERVTKHCLQGRYATLADYHDAAGEMVEPYRYLVVLDHPNGLTERASTLLRSLITSGPRCGLTTILVRAPRARSARAERSFPDLLTVKSTADGLVTESARSGPWAVRPDAPPLLALGVDSGAAAVFERVITATGTRAREAARAPVTPSTVFALVAEATRRHVRDDLPVTAAPVDPDDPTSWWTGDATRGIGAPIGRTDGRRPVSPWLDDTHGGLVVTGPPDQGVSTVLAAVVDALAVQYPPEECQLLLVGLGDRHVFAPFGDEGLPHARLVATEAERELGVSVLEACATILERRRVRLESAGTQRVGFSGHRQRTGERLPRVVLAIDGVGELFATDDTVSAAAGRLLATLAAEGPPAGVHLVVADRVSGDDEQVLLARLPAAMATHIRVGPVDADGDALGPAWVGARHDQAVITPAMDGIPAADGAADATPFRLATTTPYGRTLTIRDLRHRADDQGFAARPQVVRGDHGGDLTLAPLRQLAGSAEHREARRVPRLWVGEPVGLGAPVEVTLRRQEGANLLVVSHDPTIGQGTLFAAVATAAMVHDRSLETWVVDFLPLEAGFGALFLGLAPRSTVHVGRRRNLAKTLDTVHRVVQDRLVAGEVNGPPRLLVINGLGRAHDFDVARRPDPNPGADPRSDSDSDSGSGTGFGPAPGAGPAFGTARSGSPTLDPVGVLDAILRDGPEVGVHTVAWCDTLELLHRRLGPDALREFGLRVGGAMSADDSVALLDTAAAAALRPHHALLYDDDHGRLTKLRPYALPPDGWSPPA